MTTEEQITKLQAFKDYVHKRLDDAGIEKEPKGEHSEHGCRIGDRLDIVLSKAKRKCAKCNSNDVIMFTSDLDICNSCGCTQDGA
jgi:hypothetical protein